MAKAKVRKSVHGIPYWVEDGKFTVDGYEFFDTLADLAIDVQFQIFWTRGMAYKNLDGNWVLCI